MYKALEIPVIVCGTDVDRKTNNDLINLIKNDVDYVDLTSKTSILEYIGLIKKAKCILTNDTGIYHVAVVSQVPVTITAGAYTWDRYLNYNFKGKEKFKRPYIATKKWDCANCDNKCIHNKTMTNTWPCLLDISEEDVWKKVKEMIKNEVLK